MEVHSEEVVRDEALSALSYYIHGPLENVNYFFRNTYLTADSSNSLMSFSVFRLARWPRSYTDRCELK